MNDVDTLRESRPAGSRRIRMDVEHRGAPLTGVLDLPEHTTGLVVFAEGCGAAGGPRTALLTGHLARAGFAVLRPDLVEEAEALDPCHVRDVEVLADRLERAVHWAARHPATAGVAPCLVGTGVGAAAALLLASRPGSGVAAVVCRGGRPELAGEHLGRVRAPVLLLTDAGDRAAPARLRQVRSRLSSAPGPVTEPQRTDRASRAAQDPARFARTVADWLRGLPHGPGAAAAGGAEVAAEGGPKTLTARGRLGQARE